MTTSSLYPTHTIICKVPQSSSEFQTQIQPQRPGRFSNASQRRAPIGKKKADIEYHFEHGEVIIYILNGVSIQPVTTKMWQRNYLSVLNTKRYVWGKIHHITEYHSMFFKDGGDCIILWVCLSSARNMEFFRIKRNRIQLNTDNILEENLLQSTLHQTLGEEFPFQRDNNLQHKAKSTLELLTKKTVNVPN